MATIKNCYPSASSGKSRAKLRFEKPSAQLSTTLWTLICQVAGCWLRLSAWRKRWKKDTETHTMTPHCGHQKGGTTATNGHVTGHVSSFLCRRLFFRSRGHAEMRQTTWKSKSALVGSASYFFLANVVCGSGTCEPGSRHILPLAVHQSFCREAERS